MTSIGGREPGLPPDRDRVPRSPAAVVAGARHSPCRASMSSIEAARAAENRSGLAGGRALVAEHHVEEVGEAAAARRTRPSELEPDAARAACHRPPIRRPRRPPKPANGLPGPNGSRRAAPPAAAPARA